MALDLQLMQDSTGDDELLVSICLHHQHPGKADYQVDVLQAQLSVTACADSLATLAALAGDIAAMFATPKMCTYSLLYV